MKNFLVRISAFVLLLAIFVVSCMKEDFSIEQPSALADKLAGFDSQFIPGKYIVVFDDQKLTLPRADDFSYQQGVATMKRIAGEILKDNGIDPAKIEMAYAFAIRGIALALSDQEVARLSTDPAVDYIEQDQTVSVHGGPPFGGGGSGCSPNTSGCDPTAHYSDSGEVPWGIQAVGGPTNYTGSKKAWIIDTGIDLNNSDLNIDVANAFYSTDMKGRDQTPDDGDGHGTHVAGTVAAIANGSDVVGVAAGATVVPVRVLDKRGSGSWSGVIEGIDYVGANASAGDVANMSLGGGASSAVDQAVVNASNNGIWFALAAGNDGGDANEHSPARANGQYIRTISAIDAGLNFAYFSNWGDDVDFAAPGVSVKSLRAGGGTVVYNGTSMATPHAAGVLLLKGNSAGSCGTVSCGDTCDNTPDPIICQ